MLSDAGGELQHVCHSLYRSIGGLAFGLFRIPRCGELDSSATRRGRHFLDRAFRAALKRRVKRNRALPARGNPGLTASDRRDSMCGPFHMSGIDAQDRKRGQDCQPRQQQIEPLLRCVFLP